MPKLIKPAAKPSHKPAMASKPAAKPAKPAFIAEEAEEAEDAPIVAKPSKLAKPGAKPAPAAPAAIVKAQPDPVMAAELATLRAEIVKLTAAAAKAGKAGKGRRTAGEILSTAVFADDGEEADEDAGELSAEDWRKPYQGVRIWIKPWDRDKKQGGVAKLNETGEASYRALLAVPSEADGDWGGEARSRGELAIHYRRGDDGAFIGEPAYVDASELALIWDDALNG